MRSKASRDTLYMCHPFWFKVVYCATCDLPSVRDQSIEVAVVHATFKLLSCSLTLTIYYNKRIATSQIRQAIARAGICSCNDIQTLEPTQHDTRHFNSQAPVAPFMWFSCVLCFPALGPSHLPKPYAQVDTGGCVSRRRIQKTNHFRRDDSLLRAKFVASGSVDRHRYVTYKHHVSIVCTYFEHHVHMHESGSWPL